MNRISKSTLAALSLTLAAAWPGAPRADSFDAPYTARAMVTGTRPDTRPAGFADCLEDALVKVSGDPRLIGDHRLAPYKRHAGKWVVHFRYRDQLEGIPIHDEQGTRDRAFDLICDFDHAAINRILHALGDKPWLGERPRLAMFLGVRTALGPYVLAIDGERGIDQRDSVATAANKRGIPVVLPNQAFLDQSHIDFFRIAAADSAIDLDEAARAAGGQVPLWGTLVFGQHPIGWISQWHFRWRGKLYRWGGRGISFDEAFRRGVMGVAQILSGHGAPH
jgi:hypothetical protein